MLKKNIRRSLVFFVIVLITGFFIFLNNFAQFTDAARLINVSDYMTSHQVNDTADHTIKFTTPSGVHGPVDTITVTFDSNFDTSGITASDIDLSHGAVTGYETDETLAVSAGPGVWGASFAADVLTLTPPTNAAANEIANNAIVILEIGTVASGGTNQIVNPGANGNYPISIGGGFGDSKNFVLMIADTSVGITAEVSGDGGIGGGDPTSPIISDVQVINITPYSATVTWKTNEPANSTVNYGETESYEIGTVFDSSYVTDHSLDLVNLTPDTLYYFEVTSSDSSGNTASKGGFSFRTLPVVEELMIMNVRVENITEHSATILWETNHEADSRVDYGLTDDYKVGFEEDSTMVVAHTIPLDGLLADTTYYFSVTSSDDLGNTVSSIGHSFTTLPEEIFVPNVLDFDADPDVENKRIVLSWQNPVMPDFGGVLIKRSIGDYPATPFDGDFIYEGDGELTYDTAVEFGVEYYYAAFAYDSEGNYASGAFDWAVLIPDFTVNVKAWPEKRLPRTGNWDTNGVLSFLNPGSDFITNLYLVDTNEMGEAEVLVNDLIPGVYDTKFKGRSHLKKLLINKDIDPISDNFLDFTLGETFYLLAGDVHNTKDNYVNGLDISAMVRELYTADLDADLNQDTQVNGLDLSILVVNLYKWGD